MTQTLAKTKTIRRDEGYQDPIKLYLRDVGKAPLLSHKQEIEISQTIENGHDLFSRKDVTLIKTNHSNLPIGLRNILENNFQYLFEKSTES